MTTSRTRAWCNSSPNSVIPWFGSGSGGVVDIGQEFFRWEIATAVAGAVLGINPFDQPDVESAKVAARELTDAYESEGALPLAEPILEESGIQLFAGGQCAERLLAEAGRRTLGAVLSAHLDTVREGDYLALLAFVPRNRRTAAALERMRSAARSRLGVATCVGFGPRFLHSTGQLHKGGADNGVFLQISCSDPFDRRLSRGGISRSAWSRQRRRSATSEC